MTTDTPGSSTMDQSSKKKNWPRGRKRRLVPKDNNAPKGPLSGYMLFMGDQREIIRKTTPQMGFPEITKLVAQKWAVLESTEKQRYLDAAEIEKQRYQKELEAYQKSDLYKNFLRQQIQDDVVVIKKIQKEPPPVEEEEVVQLLSMHNNANVEIPIFTQDFLTHNKIRETELRQLRKSNTEYEEQNAILQKHIESIKMTIERMADEIAIQEKNKDALMQHLDELREKLLQSFTSVSIPGTTETPTKDSVDGYMLKLHNSLTTSPQQHHKAALSVKTIVNSMGLS